MPTYLKIVAALLIGSILIAGCGPAGPTATTALSANPSSPPVATALSASAPTAAQSPEPSGIAISPANVAQIVGLRTLGGHSPSVANLAFRADGETLASISSNFSLKLWDVESGQEVYSPLDQGERIYNVAFSPDGALMATGGSNNEIKLWDVESGQEIHTLDGHDTNLMSLAFSPDNTLLASAGDDNSIKLWDVKSGREIRTFDGHISPVIALAFSPDGTRLASGSVRFSTIIMLWDVESGNALRTLGGHTDNVHSLVFSPDGTILASASHDRTIRLWDVKSGQVMHILTGQTGPAYSMAFAPDSALFASSGDGGSIRLWDVQTGQELHTLNGHNDLVFNMAFSPDGSFLASGGIDDTVILWGIPRAGSITSDLVLPVASPTDTLSPASKTTLSLPTGSDVIAFSSYRGGESQIYTMKADGSNVTRLSTSPLRDTRPAWSPDGNRIAYVRRTSHSNHEIYVMNADGSGSTRLTTEPDSVESEPTWSPDGTQIAFISNRNLDPKTLTSRFNVFVMNADGSAQTLLTGIGGSNSSPDWAPDGKRIIFDSTRDGNYEIYAIDADGSNPVNLTNHPANDSTPAWSPDGSKIAFVSDRDGNQEIYVMNADGSNPTRLTNRFGFDKGPSWSPDGQYIVFYVRREGFNTEVYRMRADGSEQVPLTDHANFDGFPAWQPSPQVQASGPDAATPTEIPESLTAEATPERLSPSELVSSLEGLPLDEFFEVSWRELMLRDPEGVLAEGLAEAYGLQGAELTNISDAYTRETLQMYAAVLELLRQFDRDQLTPEQQISYDVYEWYLDDQVRRQEFLYYDYPATFFPITAIHEQTIHFFTDLHPIANKQDAQDYVTRLGKVDTKFEQLLEQLQLREVAGIVPPQFAIQWAIYGVQNVANSSATYTPFYEAFAEKVNALPDVDEVERQALLQAAETAIDESVLPAFQALAEYLQHQQSIASYDDGLWQFPNGIAYYEYILRHYTTTDMTADEIHELGKRELKRIHAEMRLIFDELGYPEDESLTELFDRVARDGGHVSGSEVIETYESLIEQADQNLEVAFDIRPQAKVVVVKSPIRGMYVSASQDGSRPGAFHAGPGNTSEEFYAMPTLAYHESVPGHHFQIALAQESDLPSFRNSVTFLGYAEGWALYAERLAWELGWYEDDPYGNLGRLQAEAFRAARLVVDTGLHVKGWTFDQAQEFFIENVGFEPDDSVNPEIEIARYIVWPGQSTAYKIGMIKMLELRQKAMDQLGDRFDLQEYHTVVLSNGSMPLDVLEQVVDNYIQSKLDR